jgi:hypothetical protein
MDHKPLVTTVEVSTTRGTTALEAGCWRGKETFCILECLLSVNGPLQRFGPAGSPCLTGPVDYLFASRHKGPRFKSPGGYLCETGILLLALTRYINTSRHPVIYNFHHLWRLDREIYNTLVGQEIHRFSLVENTMAKTIRNCSDRWKIMLFVTYISFKNN